MRTPKKMAKGNFIVFEGLDGSGSSTQARLLHEALIEKGHTVYLTSEPTHGPVGNLIRLAMSHRLQFSSDVEIEDRQLAYLFAADRHDHLFNSLNGIVPLVERGAIVISTRYFLSSFAYHCNSDSDIALVERLNRDFPCADVTFFLDCPVDTCLARIRKSRSSHEKYETADKLHMVRKYYDRAFERYSAPLYLINAERTQEETHREIIERTEALLRNGA